MYSWLTSYKMLHLKQEIKDEHFARIFSIHILVLEGLGKNLKQTKVDLIRP